MELQYYGANTVRIATKKASIVIDDTLADLGLKSVTKPGEIALFTGPHGTAQSNVAITINQPGEYEVSDASIQGIPARAHIDEAGTLNATMYKIILDDVRVAVLGHVHPDLTNNQLESIGVVDVLVVPIGGNGYTLDPIGALKLIKAIEPKIVIPTHYDDVSIAYPVPQQPLDAAIKSLGMEPTETVAKLKLKGAELPETTQLIVLERQ